MGGCAPAIKKPRFGEQECPGADARYPWSTSSDLLDGLDLRCCLGQCDVTANDQKRVQFCFMVRNALDFCATTARNKATVDG